MAVPADFWRFLQRGWTAHCAAAQRQRAAKAAKAGGAGGAGAAGGGNGGSGVWEVAEGEAPKQGG